MKNMAAKKVLTVTLFKQFSSHIDWLKNMAARRNKKIDRMTKFFYPASAFLISR